MPINLIKSSIFGIELEETVTEVKNLPQNAHLSFTSLDGQIYDQPSERNALGFSPNQTANALRQMSSNVMNRTHQNSLRGQSSKLHLIDNTTLTSLPFPPPPATKRLKRASHTSLRFSHRKSSNSTNIIPSSPDTSKVTRDDSIYAESYNISAYETGIDSSNYLQDDDTVEEIADDSADPIVLVEDYVTETQSEETIMRKKSLANIKKRLREEGTGSSKALNMEPSEPSQVNLMSGPSYRVPSAINEDLEAIFGKLPGAERLKYCTLCEKPLYELSSVLSNSNVDNFTLKRTPMQHFQEFVCWDCRISYDKILNELHETELSNSNGKLFSLSAHQSNRELLFKDCDSHSSNVDHDVDRSEQLEKQPCRTVKDSKRRNFSSGLIKRLQYLSEVSKPKTENSEWLTALQEKLSRNLSSLFPNSNVQVEQP